MKGLLLLAALATVAGLKCQCHSCCSYARLGAELDKCPAASANLAPTFCSGPSMGCKGRGGCYGAGTLHPYASNMGDVVGGECVCSTGEFKNAERWSLGGSVSGLPAGQSLQLMVTVSIPFNGGKAQRSTSWMVTNVRRNGRFAFPHRLASAHRYFVTTRAQPASAHCVITHERGNARADINSIRIACTRKGGGGAHNGASKRVSTGSFALRQKAFTPLKLKAPDCQDSPILYKLSSAMTPADQRAEALATALPCKREFVIHPEDKHKDGFYITELRGARCAHAEVHADRPVHACLVPAAIWYQLGVSAVLGDKQLCPCRGVKQCTIDKSGLSPHTTYLLFVKESKDRSKLHFHSYSDLITSYKPVRITVYLESCAAARKKQMIEVGACVLGAAVVAAVLAKGGNGKKSGYSQIQGQELSSR